MRNSAPKFERRDVTPKVRWFRASHGAMQAKNTSPDSTTPVSEDLPRCQRRYHAHSPEAGRNASREVLARTAIPQSKPNWIHGTSPSLSSRSSVSQTQRVHQYITDGLTAHSQAVQIASFSSKHRLAIRKMGMQVSAENRLLIISSTSAEAWV